MNNNYYDEKYIPSIVKIGRIAMFTALVVFFVPFLATWMVLGIKPEWPYIIKAAGTWILMNIVPWIVEPLTFFPILGIPGTFIGFLAGNSTNIRIPCATASQKVTGTTPGTNEGQVMATIGICVSVFVNLIILATGVILGQAILSALPESITSVLNYLLPALYGCVFAQFFTGNEKSGIVAIILAIGMLLLSRNGLLNWIPFDYSYLLLIVPIFGTMAIVAAMLRGQEKKDDQTQQ